MQNEINPYFIILSSRKQSVYEGRKMAGLRFRKFIAVEKTITRIARNLVGNQQDTIVFLGNFRLNPNSPIKGYRRTPFRLLASKLNRMADVMLIDEFRTTRLCSECHEPVFTSRRKHRYQVCPNQDCDIKCWNRDVNAGNNMVYNGLRTLLGDELHTNYLRSTQLP